MKLGEPGALATGVHVGWHALRYSEGRGDRRLLHALRSTSGRATHQNAILRGSTMKRLLQRLFRGWTYVRSCQKRTVGRSSLCVEALEERQSPSANPAAPLLPNTRADFQHAHERVFSQAYRQDSISAFGPACDDCIVIVHESGILTDGIEVV